MSENISLKKAAQSHCDFNEWSFTTFLEWWNFIGYMTEHYIRQLCQENWNCRSIIPGLKQFRTQSMGVDNRLKQNHEQNTTLNWGNITFFINSKQYLCFQAVGCTARLRIEIRGNLKVSGRVCGNTIFIELSLLCFDGFLVMLYFHSLLVLRLTGSPLGSHIFIHFTLIGYYTLHSKINLRNNVILCNLTSPLFTCNEPNAVICGKCRSW